MLSVMEMRPSRLRALLLFAVLLLPCAAARAQDGEPEPVAGPGFARWDRGPWELGLDVGMMYPTGSKVFSHVIDNQRAFDLLAAETVGDEVGEGWVPPSRPGTSVVSGKMNQLTDVGLHLYYRKNSWLAYGLDGGYGIRRNMKVRSKGVYDAANFLTLTYTGNIIHLSAPAKIGPAFGPVRPYVLAGPGLYMVQERGSILFNDGDDPQLLPLEIIRKDTIYAGVHLGAGVEWRVERGAVGLDVSYHKIFSGNSGGDFIEPKLRFAYLF
jgi:hypothetical protein